MSFPQLPILIIGLLISVGCYTQVSKIEKIASQVSSENLKKNLYYLTSEQLEGRLIASKGDTLAAIFIADWFKKNRVIAPYNNARSYFQSATTYKSLVEESALTINGKTYSFADGWIFDEISFPTSIKLENTPVVFVGYGFQNASRDDLTGVDITGKPVIMLRGQPKDSTGNYISSGTKEPVHTFVPLRSKGSPVVLRPDPSDTTLQKLPNVLLSRSSAFKAKNRPNRSIVGQIRISDRLLNEILNKDGITINELIKKDHKKIQSFETKNKISLHVKIKEVEAYSPNVIGIIEGSDTSAGHIIMLAHHDGKDEEGGFHPAAVDNATGTAALMEFATLFNKAAKLNLQPKRTIILFSSTGEETGMTGVQSYIDHPVIPLNKIWAVLNIDMLGGRGVLYEKEPLSQFILFDLRDSVNHGLEKALLKANDIVKLKIVHEKDHFTYNPTDPSFSDARLFHRKGIPVLALFCGDIKEYHRRTDTPDKVDIDLFKKQTQLAFLTLWNLANE